jgi:hypothetical protein
MKIIYPHTHYLEFPNQQFVDIAELATIADMISLHCTPYEKTEKLKKNRSSANWTCQCNDYTPYSVDKP